MQFSETAKSITPAEKGTILSHIPTTSALEGNNPLCAQPSVGQPAWKEAACSTNSTLQHEHGNLSAPIHHQDCSSEGRNAAALRWCLLPFIRDSEITQDTNYSPYNTQACADPAGFSCHPLQKLSLTQSQGQCGCPAWHRTAAAAAAAGRSSLRGSAAAPTPPTPHPVCSGGLTRVQAHKRNCRAALPPCKQQMRQHLAGSQGKRCSGWLVHTHGVLRPAKLCPGAICTFLHNAPFKGWGKWILQQMKHVWVLARGKW